MSSHFPRFSSPSGNPVLEYHCHRPITKLREGNVFSRVRLSVCYSVHKMKGAVIDHMGTLEANSESVQCEHVLYSTM